MVTYYIGVDVHSNNTELAIEQRGRIVARYSVPTTITKPLIEHIADYVKVLKAKRFSAGYIRHTHNRLKKIVRDCRFFYFRDISKTAVEIYIGKLIKDELSATTAGHYLDCFKTFLNWAEQDQRIMKNLITKMAKPARDSEKKGVLEPEQFVHLIKTTSQRNILIGGTSGQERAVLYLTGRNDRASQKRAA